MRKLVTDNLDNFGNRADSHRLSTSSTPQDEATLTLSPAPTLPCSAVIAVTEVIGYRRSPPCKWRRLGNLARSPLTPHFLLMVKLAISLDPLRIRIPPSRMYIYTSALQALAGRGSAGCLEGGLQGYRGRAMHYLGYELPRIPIPRSRLNKALRIEDSSPLHRQMLCWYTVLVLCPATTEEVSMSEEEEDPRSESEEQESKEDPRSAPHNIANALEDFFLKYQVLKVVLSLVLVIFAITRFYYYEALNTRMDLVFLSLVLSVFLLWMLPWEQLWDRLRGFSVGGVAISLQQPDVHAAISNISFDDQHLKIIGSRTSEDVRERLIQRLKSLEGDLQIVRGSRVLWIDDNPHNILGERRLLRALGIDVTPAISSKEAHDILEKDNDFDLIITDVQRQTTEYDSVDNGFQVHGGVNFIVKLRKEEKDDRIKTLPVIFYGAYSWKDLVNYTRRARELQPAPEIPAPEISESVVDLIPKVIRRLSEERLHPIEVSAKKKGTRIREQDNTLNQPR
jgi:CheY-like chemotaxis protein